MSRTPRSNPAAHPGGGNTLKGEMARQRATSLYITNSYDIILPGPTRRPFEVFINSKNMEHFGLGTQIPL